MKICKKCGRFAAITLSRYGLSFCSKHFLEFMRGRVKKIIQKYHLLNPYERVAVALSGGKDSTVLFHILDSIYSETVDLVGLHINLGIMEQNYSKTSLRLAKTLCEAHKRPFYCIDVQREYQLTMDLVKRKARQIGRSPCGICGIFKRYLLNRCSLKLNCEKLATGHVLDDEVSVLLMNLFHGNIHQLVRTGPKLDGKALLMVTRIKPLYEISEVETMAYAFFEHLEIQEDACPYSRDASSLKYKGLIQNFDQVSPGISNIFLQNFLKKFLPPLKESHLNQVSRVKPCTECNAPTTEAVCAFCTVKKALMRVK
ncbi:MAG: ATP-binding protein [Candidatus Helarchaeota archaeon]